MWRLRGDAWRMLRLRHERNLQWDEHTEAERERGRSNERDSVRNLNGAVAAAVQETDDPIQDLIASDEEAEGPGERATENVALDDVRQTFSVANWVAGRRERKVVARDLAFEADARSRVPQRRCKEEQRAQDAFREVEPVVKARDMSDLVEDDAAEILV